MICTSTPWQPGRPFLLILVSNVILVLSVSFNFFVFDLHLDCVKVTVLLDLQRYRSTDILCTTDFLCGVHRSVSHGPNIASFTEEFFLKQENI